MTSPLWRAILWVERFLPAAPTPAARPSSAAKRWATLVPALIYPLIVLPSLLRQRHEVGSLIAGNLGVVRGLALLMAGGALLAAIGVGIKAWHDARGAR